MYILLLKYVLLVISLISNKLPSIFLHQKKLLLLTKVKYHHILQKKLIKNIGGTTFEKHVRNALTPTLIDQMAYKMS